MLILPIWMKWQVYLDLQQKGQSEHKITRDMRMKSFEKQRFFSWDRAYMFPLFTLPLSTPFFSIYIYTYIVYLRVMQSGCSRGIPHLRGRSAFYAYVHNGGKLASPKSWQQFSQDIEFLTSICAKEVPTFILADRWWFNVTVAGEFFTLTLD